MGCRSVYSGQLANVMFQDWSGSGESQSQSHSLQSDSLAAQRLSKEDSNSSSSEHWPGSNSGIDQAAEARALMTRDGMWSKGSERHSEGTCKPCHYVHTSRGCNSGQDCTFCHLPHVQTSNKGGNRPCKSKREQCRKILGLIGQIAESGENAQVLQVYENVACQSTYMQGMLQKHWNSGRDQQQAPGEEHKPTVEDGSESVLQRMGASASIKDRPTNVMQMSQVPPDVHLGASGCDQMASLALPSRGRRRSLVSL